MNFDKNYQTTKNMNNYTVNPLKPNGVSHSHQLDHFISVLWVVRLYFLFNFNRTFFKQTAGTLIRCSDLGLQCLPMSHNKEARLK